MSEFLDPLRVEKRDDGTYRVLECFTYRVGSKDSSEVIEVPADFICDGQSYPRIFGMIDNPMGQGAKAGFIHDYLYWLNGRRVPKTGIEYTRLRSDLIFLEALAVSGLSEWRAFIRFLALRFAGGPAWKSHTKRIKKEMEELAQLKVDKVVAEVTGNGEERQEIETQIIHKVDVLRNGETAIPEPTPEQLTGRTNGGSLH